MGHSNADFCLAGDFENKLNSLFSGKEIQFEFNKNGKPLTVNLNGRKAKNIVAEGLAGNLEMATYLPGSSLPVSRPLRDLFRTFTERFGEFWFLFFCGGGRSRIATDLYHS